MVKFGYTILYVQNVEKSVAFYENAFGFSRKFVTPESDYGELSTGETTICVLAPLCPSLRLAEEVSVTA